MGSDFGWQGHDRKKAVMEEMNLQMADWPQVF